MDSILCGASHTPPIVDYDIQRAQEARPPASNKPISSCRHNLLFSVTALLTCLLLRQSNIVIYTTTQEQVISDLTRVRRLFRMRLSPFPLGSVAAI